MADYIVTGPMAIVNLDNGSAVHLMRNASVPGNVDPEHLQHLVDNGLVAEVGEFVGGLEPVYTGDLQKQVTAVDAEQLEDPKPFTAGSADIDSEADADQADVPPAKSAAKPEWVDYAVAQGASREDAEASTKDDLIAQYGSA